MKGRHRNEKLKGQRNIIAFLLSWTDGMVWSMTRERGSDTFIQISEIQRAYVTQLEGLGTESHTHLPTYIPHNPGKRSCAHKASTSTTTRDIALPPEDSAPRAGRAFPERNSCTIIQSTPEPQVPLEIPLNNLRDLVEVSKGKS